MLIFLLLLAVFVLWGVLYFTIIRPKLVAFRYTAGIYAKLDAVELSAKTRLLLWLKGLKVLIAGVITSTVPVVPLIYDKVSGIDWTQIFPSERAKLVGVVIIFAGVAGPMLMVVLHNFGMAEAASIPPKE